MRRTAQRTRHAALAVAGVADPALVPAAPAAAAAGRGQGSHSRMTRLADDLPHTCDAALGAGTVEVEVEAAARPHSTVDLPRGPDHGTVVARLPGVVIPVLVLARTQALAADPPHRTTAASHGGRWPGP